MALHKHAHVHVHIVHATGRRLVTQALVAVAGLCLAGGVALAQRPVIAADGVQNAASNTPDVAQGSVFVVKGTNLCAPGFVPASLPLPLELNNVRITFTPAGGGTAVDAFMRYTYNQGGVTQLSGVVPSTLAAGAYNVTVNNGGQISEAVRANVVARKFGIFTVSGSGAGRAVIQNFVSQSQLDLNRFTTGSLSGFTLSPSKPGQIVILWGTGLGPISRPDNAAPGVIDLRSQEPVRVLVGTTEITPDFYAGRAPEFPGADMVQFTLPSNVPTGCTVPLQVRVGTQASNTAFLSIASGEACSHPRYSRTALEKLDAGGTLVAGSFVLSSFSLSVGLGIPGVPNINVYTENISGSFARYGGDQLNDPLQLVGATGGCQVFRRVGTTSVLLLGVPPTTLDAGASLALNGPNLSNKAVRRGDGNLYVETLGTSTGLPGIPGGGSSATVSAGRYTLTGAGGADVRGFTAAVDVGAPLRVGTVPDTIPRNSPLTVTWTGGAANDLVSITGISGVNAPGSTPANQVYDAGVFVCTTNAGAGSFTIPASVLGQLPATPAGGFLTGNGIGSLGVSATTAPSTGSGTFTATLASGEPIDIGLFIATVGTQKFVAYQ